MSSPSFHVGKVDDSLEAYLSIAGEASFLAIEPTGNCTSIESEVRTFVSFAVEARWPEAWPSIGWANGLVVERSPALDSRALRLVLPIAEPEPAQNCSPRCCAELHSEGLAIASLYASTQYLYRTVGFEQAGTQTNLSIPIASIHCNDRALQAHRFLSPPLGVLQRIAEARAEISNGNIQRTEGLWQRLLKPYDCSGTITYVIGDIDAAQGFAIFRSGARERSHPQPLISTDVVALTGAASRRLLTLVRDHRSMCDSFEWFGPPDDTLPLFANEQFVKVKAMMRWLLRIVSLPAALASAVTMRICPVSCIWRFAMNSCQRTVAVGSYGSRGDEAKWSAGATDGS